MRRVVHAVFLSVIVHVVDVNDIAARESKHHPPAAADVHCPGPLQSTLERVQSKSGKAHVSWFGGYFQPCKNQT
jgi:hypothetical protein